MAPAPKLVTPDYDDMSLGPAMQACSERQRRLAFAIVYQGFGPTHACKAAGYADSTSEANQTAIVQHPKVQAAIEELARGLLKTHAGAAVRVLVEIVGDVTQSADARRKAAESILNRAGLGVATEHTLRVVHQMSAPEKKARLIALADELGLDENARAKLLLPPSPPVIDAEFSEVSPEPAAPTGREGLEDLLGLEKEPTQ